MSDRPHAFLPRGSICRDVEQALRALERPRMRNRFAKMQTEASLLDAQPHPLGRATASGCHALATAFACACRADGFATAALAMTASRPACSSSSDNSLLP